MRQQRSSDARLVERTDRVTRHAQLYFALCTKRPQMIDSLFDVYASAVAFVRVCLHKLGKLCSLLSCFSYFLFCLFAAIHYRYLLLTRVCARGLHKLGELCSLFLVFYVLFVCSNSLPLLTFHSVLCARVCTSWVIYAKNNNKAM
jgi:hypothetical protein